MRFYSVVEKVFGSRVAAILVLTKPIRVGSVDVSAFVLALLIGNVPRWLVFFKVAWHESWLA
jgi:hypothetical protein